MTAIPEPLEYREPERAPRRRRSLTDLADQASGTAGRMVDALGGLGGRGGLRGTGGRRGRGGRGGRGEEIVVPEPEFRSYYGRQIVKPAPWSHEIPAYLFLGGLAGGSALLAAGAEMTGRRELQRNTRLIALGALAGSGYALVADLGKPSRFYNMLRTVKLTSPMSVGSWILTGYAGFTSLAAASEIVKEFVPQALDNETARVLLPIADRVASLGAGAFAAPLASYTAVLLSDTATPTWHAIYKELPFVFVGSALAASGGAAMVTTRTDQTAPARRMAVGGALLESLATYAMERPRGHDDPVGGDLVRTPLHEGKAGTMLRIAKALTIGGGVLSAVGGRRRPTAILGGAALLAGSALTRFGIFEAGMASAKDPKYTVVPQRARLAARQEQARSVGGRDSGSAVSTL